MKELFILKCGELILKGLNRHHFEAKLISNIRFALKGLGDFAINLKQSAITVEPKDDTDLDEVYNRLKKVFGIVSVCRAVKAPKDIGKINEIAVRFLKDTLFGGVSFKVEAKRADKKFSLKSPDICYAVGGYILENIAGTRVDVINPQYTVMVEIRDEWAFIHVNSEKGAGGMPCGTNGKAALLLSGGIDSPVAGYMIAKRGAELCAVHFHSHPYTSERALRKVCDLARILSQYCLKIELFIVPFTDIQLEINEKCPGDMTTIIMRRFMMRIAQEIALKNGAMALITGESLGQVASQTIGGLMVTDAIAQIPVFRPLIGMDKEEIITVARKIDTFETSSLPYEDCCTIFVPKHPKTKPTIPQADEAEKALDTDTLVAKAVAATEKKEIRFY